MTELPIRNTILIDASNEGWEATSQFEKTNGRWNDEIRFHIDDFECLTIFLTPTPFKKTFKL